MSTANTSRSDPTTQTGTIEILTDEEIARVMEEAKNYGYSKDKQKWIALMSVLANYGPRISELLSTPDRPGLRWDHVDFSRGTITFPTLKRRRPAFRTLPLLGPVADLLAQYRMTVNGSPYVFPTTKHGRTVAWRAFQKMLVRAGIPRVKLHSLRHSCATRLVQIDLAVARDTLGHANISTTNRYIHAVKLRDTFAALKAITPGTAPADGKAKPWSSASESSG